MKEYNNIKPNGLKGSETIDRMKSLMDIRTPINENKQNSVVELTKLGPDGKTYGIVRENHKYFIKTSDKTENVVAEDFKYLGGLKNLHEGSFPSYSKAAKQLNLKFISIAEALGVSKMYNVLKNDNLTEEFVSYSEPVRASQPDTPLGTVKSIGKNDGHDKEIIGDAGETGGEEDTPPVVEESDVEETINHFGQSPDKDDDHLDDKDDKTIEEDIDVELNENEKAIDRMILEMRGEPKKVEPVKKGEPKKAEPKKVVNENKLSIATALQKIDEGVKSQKKKV